MSTGLNCEFYEMADGEWYYVLEEWNAPKMAFNWREFAECYGPFTTQDEARQHLHDHHANPGGSMTIRYTDDYFDGYDDEVLKKLIAGATKPDARGAVWRLPRR